jgi:hypothetical protein
MRKCVWSFSGSKVQGLGFKVLGSGFWVQRFRVQGSGFRVQGSGFKGSGFKVQRFIKKVSILQP